MMKARKGQKEVSLRSYLLEHANNSRGSISTETAMKRNVNSYELVAPTC